MLGADKTTRKHASAESLLFLVGSTTYVALALAGHTFLAANVHAAIWPAAGILTATLLLTDKRYWPWILLVATVSDLAANHLFGGSVRNLFVVPHGVLMAYLVRRTCPKAMNFADPRSLTMFIVKAVLPTNLVATALVPLVRDPPVPLHALPMAFLGHSLASAIVVPMIAILFDQRRFSAFRRPAWELPVICCMAGAYVAILFAAHNPMLMLLIFPIVMFVAFRYGPVGVCWVSSLMMAMAIVRICWSVPGQPVADVVEIQWLQLIVGVVFLTSLPAAGALASLHRTRKLLAERNALARVARRRADQAVLAKSEFLANMSHEIRTPLNGVIGLTDALSRTPLAAKQREMLAMVLSSGKALNGLLSDILDLARADSGALNLTEEPFDIREAVSHASFLFANLAQDKGVEFHVTFDLENDRAALGDALRIRQIVSNLISNAVKFTSRGSVDVEVSLREQGLSHALLQITVRDTGPGFDASVKARLFNRFEQGDGSVTRRFGGTGLGLAISQRLAQLMGGDIDCDAAPGVGAQFTFSVALPLLDKPLVAEPATVPHSISSTGGVRPKILLAEDHPINQRVIQAILGDDFELTVVADGQAAVDAHAVQPFDLILMDTHMPVMDGLSAIKAIRARESANSVHTPIVSLTADALPVQIWAALAAGADLHLAKPITAASLLAAMDSTLRRDAA
jgi:signal transduction histidine kinase/ActR/RegA family two-component response regulator